MINVRQAKILESRLHREAELYRQGKTFGEIAAVVTAEFRTPEEKPFSFKTIAKDMARIRAEWRTSRIADFDAKIDKELAVIDHLEAEAWAGWQRSIGKVKVTTQKTTAEGEETTVRTEHQAGDPRFLAQVDSCVDKRCRILGLYAAIKTQMELTGEALTKLVADARARVRNKRAPK